MIEHHLAAFPRSYDAEVVRELPNTSLRRVFIPGGSETGGRDGLLVSVRPHNRPQWFGVFGFGSGGPVMALSSTPDINTLLVVSRGAGYFVKADDPQTWSDTDSKIIPVKGLHPIPDLGMIVMHDHTTVAAFGAGPMLWRTGRISFDGIVIKQIGTDFIEGEGWDPTSRVPPKFRINTRTGEHEGGANTDKYPRTLICGPKR